MIQFVKIVLPALFICSVAKAQHTAVKIKPSVNKPASPVHVTSAAKPKQIIDFAFLVTLRSDYPGCIDSLGYLLPAAAKLEKLHITGPVSNLQGLDGFTSLKELTIEGSWIPSFTPAPVIIPALPASLIILNCAKDSIYELPPLPKGLQELNCRGNHLTKLPPFPPTLKKADIGWNMLTSCPALPEGLTYLNIADHNLTSLPHLPSTLRMLIINFDLIQCVPNTNDLLKIKENDFTEYETRLKICETEVFANDNTVEEKPALVPIYFFDAADFDKKEEHSYSEAITEIKGNLDGARVVVGVAKKDGFGYHKMLFTVNYNDSRTGIEYTSNTFEVKTEPGAEKVSQLIHFTGYGIYKIRAYVLSVNSKNLVAEGNFSVVR